MDNIEREARRIEVELAGPRPRYASNEFSMRYVRRWIRRAVRLALRKKQRPTVHWQPATVLPPPEMVLVAKEFLPGDWRIKIGYFDAGGVRNEKPDWVVIGASWLPSHWSRLPFAPDGKEGK